MKRIVLAGFVLAAGLSAAAAENFSLPYGQPAAFTVSVPAGWTPHETPDGVDGIAPDKKVSFFIGALKNTSLDAAREDGVAVLTRTGMTIDKSKLEEGRRKVGKLDVIDAVYPARDDNKPVKVIVTVAPLAQGGALQLVAWGPPAAVEKNIVGLNKILATVKLAKP